MRSGLGRTLVYFVGLDWDLDYLLHGPFSDLVAGEAALLPAACHLPPVPEFLRAKGAPGGQRLAPL